MLSSRVFIIGNTDRHHSNWAVLAQFDNNAGNVRFKKCPLYDNGSSLCSYVNELQVSKYLGKDLGPMKSLVDSKSRSIIRIDGSNKTKPKHREMIEYLSEQYEITKSIIKKYVDRLSDDKIDSLLLEYEGKILSANKTILICNFLKWKMKILREILEEN